MLRKLSIEETGKVKANTEKIRKATFLIALRHSKMPLRDPLNLKIAKDKVPSKREY